MAITKKAYEKILQQAKRFPKAQRRSLVRELWDEQDDSLESFIPKRGKIVKLGGLWEGIDITEEDIAQARREMWGKFGQDVED